LNRSLTGEGNFNWRFVFDFQYLEIEEKIFHEKKDSVFQIGTSRRKIPPRIVLRVYDADLLSADDFLGLLFNKTSPVEIISIVFRRMYSSFNTFTDWCKNKQKL